MVHDKAIAAASTAALQLGPYYFLCDKPTLARASYGTIHILFIYVSKNPVKDFYWWDLGGVLSVCPVCLSVQW